MNRLMPAGFALFLVFTASQLRAATIHVPVDYPTIQDAIWAANAGDTVVVAPGTYGGGIDFWGEAITVTSTNPLNPAVVAATVISGGGPVFTFDHGEGPASVLTGFTITGGGAYPEITYGGGILCNGSSPTIEHNIITGNGLTSTAFEGGGIACLDSSPVIQDNTISKNSSLDGSYTASGDGGNGGGIYCQGGSPTIQRNVITGNRTGDGYNAFPDMAAGTGGNGGGICCEGGSPTIRGNTVTGNATGRGSDSQLSPFGTGIPYDGGPAGDGGGIYVSGAAATIEGNVIVGNHAGAGGAGAAGGNMAGGQSEARGTDGGSGGGICLKGSTGTVVRNLVAGNSAGTGGDGYDKTLYVTEGGGGKGGSGGGIYASTTGSLAIVSNTLADNSAGIGGLGENIMYSRYYDGRAPFGVGGGICVAAGGTVTVSNCIIAFNGTGGGLALAGTGTGPDTSYCDLYGNASGDAYLNPGGNTVGFKPTGAGIISADPLFADEQHRDYHEKSKVGRWTASGWVVDSVTSPCLDAGDPSSEFRLEPIPNGGRINMGAYGDTAQASKSVRTYQPDLMLRAVQSDAVPFVGENVYNTTGVNQTLTKTTAPGVTTRFFLRLRNNGNVMDNVRVTGLGGNATWQVHYFDAPSGGTDITSQVTGAGWAPKVVSGAAVDFRVEVTPRTVAAGGLSRSIRVTAASVSDPAAEDVVLAVTDVATVYQPDALVRVKGQTPIAFVGAGIYNTTAAGQTVTASTGAGKTVTYLLRLFNDGDATDSFTMTGPAGGDGWSVSYFDAATGGSDITAQVTGSGWTTPALTYSATLAYRDLRVEVTPDSTVTSGASKAVKVTFRSTHDATKVDAVKGTTTKS